MVLEGSYYFLEEEKNQFEEYESKYNCRYHENAFNQIEVQCAIEQGPSVITHGRSGDRSDPPPNTFNGVRGFSFISKTTDPKMPSKMAEKNLSEEIGFILDFVRNPTEF